MLEEADVGGLMSSAASAERARDMAAAWWPAEAMEIDLLGGVPVTTGSVKYLSVPGFRKLLFL
eukprot:COSAG05_NODE_11708_length_500_cov_1.411471_2_plen_62_part_01